MIKLLNQIIKTLSFETEFIQLSLMNPDLLKKKGEDAEMLYFMILGEKQFMLYKSHKRLNAINSIREHSISELRGTYYEDYEKRWAGTDMERPYTQHMVYGSILSNWDFKPSLLIEPEVIDIIDKHADLDSKLTEGLMKFAPGAGPYVFSEDGEAHKQSLFDVQLNNAIKAGSAMTSIEEYNVRIEQIKILAENQGNLAEIIRLTEL